MQKKYIFAGTPAKYAAVMWGIAEELGDSLGATPDSFCLFASRDPLFQPFDDIGLLRVPAETMVVETWFRAQQCWEPLSTKNSRSHSVERRAADPAPPESPILEFSFVDSDGVEVFETDYIYATIRVEEMPSSESLLTIEADDEEWPRLKSTWDLLFHELKLRNRLRDIDEKPYTPEAPESVPNTKAVIQQPKRQIRPTIKKRRGMVKDLDRKGYGRKEIVQALKGHKGMACSPATVSRDLVAIREEGSSSTES